MSPLMRLITRFYAPLIARGTLIDGLSTRTSASDGRASQPPGVTCAPFAQSRGSVRTSARSSHARETRASLAA